MMERYLSDQCWEAIAPVLPGKDGDPGCSGRDNRQFLEAVFWIARTGEPWRNLPPEFGKWYTTYTRYHRWEKRGVWPRVLEALAQDGASDFSYHPRQGLRFTPLRAIITRENEESAEKTTDGFEEPVAA